MALTVKHLNGDASFLLTFEPAVPGSRPFRILLDPWITPGPSTVFHSRISTTTRKEPACISSLLELPDLDLIIISQEKSDHCNKATLQQLPRDTTTLLLAEPNAARTIRGWKYFEKDRVRTIPRWEEPKANTHETVIRIPVPSVLPGEPGEITVALITQSYDLSGLHNAIGITYRPPLLAAHHHQSHRGYSPLTPPATPRSHRSDAYLRSTFTSHHLPLPPTPTTPTHPLRSVRSTSSLTTTTTTSQTNQPPSISSPQAHRPLSVLFSPHGIPYTSLHGYTTTHLVREAALPLTALLHCFDCATNPWWLGGKLLLGAPAGMETASRLGARALISAHDGAKAVAGFGTGFLRTRVWRREEVAGEMGSRVAVWRDGRRRSRGRGLSPHEKEKGSGRGTEVLVLKSGEEVVLRNGFRSDRAVVWDADADVDAARPLVKQAEGAGDQDRNRGGRSDTDQTLIHNHAGNHATAGKGQRVRMTPVLARAAREGTTSFASLEEVLARGR
ncbi:hypothetical protein B0T19DRAFT_437260 [Cercophora scortea]|uniref:Beta-lactamase superfamily domain-containing protein n=1 Tax=Cercophora scortea TaxID=314031 RepID=A0AAE0J5C4_9PEZI|nr:hypothetical protein B0T19DRAFT_437260 [Cercophora scortea]